MDHGTSVGGLDLACLERTLSSRGKRGGDRRTGGLGRPDPKVGQDLLDNEVRTSVSRKTKHAVRRGRKAAGLADRTEKAGLPKERRSPSQRGFIFFLEAIGSDVSEHE
jgi:hypothetical protein